MTVRQDSGLGVNRSVVIRVKRTNGTHVKVRPLEFGALAPIHYDRVAPCLRMARIHDDEVLPVLLLVVRHLLRKF